MLTSFLQGKPGHKRRIYIITTADDPTPRGYQEVPTNIGNNQHLGGGQGDDYRLQFNYAQVDNKLPVVEELPVSSSLPNKNNIPLDNGISEDNLDSKKSILENIPLGNTVPGDDSEGEDYRLTFNYAQVDGRVPTESNGPVDSNDSILKSIPMDNTVPADKSNPVDSNDSILESIPMDNTVPADKSNYGDYSDSILESIPLDNTVPADNSNPLDGNNSILKSIPKDNTVPADKSNPVDSNDSILEKIPLDNTIPGGNIPMEDITRGSSRGHRVSKDLDTLSGENSNLKTKEAVSLINQSYDSGLIEDTTSNKEKKKTSAPRTGLAYSLTDEIFDMIVKKVNIFHC